MRSSQGLFIRGVASMSSHGLYNRCVRVQVRLCKSLGSSAQTRCRQRRRRHSWWRRQQTGCFVFARLSDCTILCCVLYTCMGLCVSARVAELISENMLCINGNTSTYYSTHTHTDRHYCTHHTSSRIQYNFVSRLFRGSAKQTGTRSG